MKKYSKKLDEINMSIDFIEQIKQDIRDDAVKEYKEEIKQSLEAEGLNQEKIERILKI